MKKLVYNVPNFLTITRLMLIPLYLYYSIRGDGTAFGFVFFIAFSTDFFDGLFARMLNQESKLGARLDTIADNLGLIAAIYGMDKLFPKIFTKNRIVFILGFVTFIFQYLLRIFKAKEIGTHLYSGKISTTLIFFFILYTVFFEYNQIFFNIVIIFFFTTMIDYILVLLLRKKVTPETKGILFK